MKFAREMENFSSVMVAIAMIAAFLLAAGGARLVAARQTRVRGILMLAAAAVLLMNVTIWTM
jgi:hypothetical protein